MLCPQFTRLVAIVSLLTPKKTCCHWLQLIACHSENRRFVSAFHQALHLSHHPYPSMTILYTRAGKVISAR